MLLDELRTNAPFFFIRDLGPQKLKAVFGNFYDPTTSTLDAPPDPGDTLLDQSVHRDFASALAFYNVEDLDGVSAIPSVFGSAKPERDLPYGWMVETHRNFIRIFLMQQTRIHMSKKPKSKLKDLSRARELLPNEIFFEIFSHLRPIDLYNLCLAGQPFYDFLVGPEARSEATWRGAYRFNDPATDPHGLKPIPLPPKQFSSFRWAHLLFGPSSCSAPPPGSPPCNRHGAVIDAVHCHRVCRLCWVKYYASKGKVTVSDPDGIIWDVLPSSCRRMGGRLSIFYSNKKYYIPEMRRMEKFLATQKVELSEDMYFQLYRSLQTEAHELAKCAEEYRGWTDNIIFQAGVYLDGCVWRGWKPKLDKKLVKLGFTAQEANGATRLLTRMKSDRLLTIHKLTHKIWEKFRPRLVKSAEEARVADHRTLLAWRLSQEIRQVRQLWTQFLRLQKPATWEQLPTVQHVMGLEPIYSEMVDGVIERLKGNPNSIDSTEPGRYDKYIDQLPNLVLRWQQDTLSHYAAKIPRSHTSSSQVDSSYDVLSLATSVFECLNCSSIKDKTQSWQAGRTLIGWRALNGHLSCTFRKWKDQLEYSNKGAEAAQSLVILAGLSPQRALATDLDSLDYRFTCGNCEIGPTGRRGSRGHKVWTWRECVYHFIQMNRVEDPDHQTPRWNRLSPEMSAYIKRRETPGDVSDLSWSCLHCPSAWGSQEDRSRTIQHVVESHQIQRPKDDVDYTHSMRGPSSPRVAVGLSEYPTPEQYYCLRCDKPRGRLYAHQSIILHLLDKHEIRDPEEGCEYACIPLYDAHYPVS